MKMTLIKYKALKLLVNENSHSALFLDNIEKIEALDVLTKEFVSDLLNPSQLIMDEINRLKNQLASFINMSGVIGFPFDNHDAELYAYDRKINFDILELHGNKGKQNAKKEEVKESKIQFRCDSSMKSAWVKTANMEGMKLTEWIISKCEPHNKFK